VVDDEFAVTKLAEVILSRYGYRVLLTDTPAAAFDVLARETIHLIITDVHMPGLAGPELMSRLRAQGLDVPVLFISGDFAVETVERSLDVPGAMFLPKPFTADELVQAVAATIR
jgi:DNA-binding response OmpR family regulator